MLELGTISEQHKLAAPMSFEPHSSYQLSKSSSYKLGAGYQQYPRSYKLLDNIPAAPSNSIRASLEPLSQAKEAVPRAIEPQQIVEPYKASPSCKYWVTEHHSQAAIFILNSYHFSSCNSSLNCWWKQNSFHYQLTITELQAMIELRSQITKLLILLSYDIEHIPEPPLKATFELFQI